jgi:hypothetical protein
VSGISSPVLKEDISLTVRGAARVTSSFASLITISFRGGIELQCDGVGSPLPELYWTKGSVSLTNVLKEDW